MIKKEKTETIQEEATETKEHFKIPKRGRKSKKIYKGKVGTKREIFILLVEIKINNNYKSRMITITELLD